MKRLIAFCALAIVTSVALLSSSAASNLNSSRSNIYRIIWATDIGLSQTQGDALVKELDKQGSLTEAKAKAWMVNNFKAFGVDATRVKLIRVLLQQGISCNATAGACKGKWKAPPLSAQGDCYCYEPFTSPAQGQRVGQEKMIVVLLLSDPNAENDAFNKATDMARLEKDPEYIRTRQQAIQSLSGVSSSARRTCCCYFTGNGGNWGWCACGKGEICLTQF